MNILQDFYIPVLQRSIAEDRCVLSLPAFSAENSAWKTSVGFHLSFLRLRMASSTFSLKETLKRRKDRVVATRRYMQPEEDINADPEARDTIYGEQDEGIF